MKKENFKVEVQVFGDCPNAAEMIKRVKNAINSLRLDADYSETYVETPDDAEKVKFRGSPTVLVNGIDLELMPEPEKGNLVCRYYRDGIPKTEEIEKFMRDQFS